MKTSPQVGLVCAGVVSRSVLGRIPGLRQRVQWVKSSTISAASRAANSLGSGIPVRNWEGLDSASLIFVQAPDPLVPSILDEMAESKLDWSDRSVVLVDSEYGSSALLQLETAGASPASLNWLGSAPDRYLLEGDETAIRQVRLLLRRPGMELIEIRRGAKAEYLSGVRQATDCFLPLLSETVERFVRAGMGKPAAERTAAQLVESTMRAYFRAGKRLLRPL